MASSKKKKKKLLLLAAAFIAVDLLVLSRFVCLSAFLFSGLLVEECPDGQAVQTVCLDAYGLRRGAEGTIYVSAVAHYTSDQADEHRETAVRRLRAEVALVAGDRETPLAPVKGWGEDGAFRRHGRFVLPEVPDGDYLIRARVSSPLGQAVQDLPVGLYAPARVHVLTDRPLYEPGNTVQFRAVVLRARDLAPLDGRPGRFLVLSPSGETVLEEKAPAGDFGVVAGSFPLDGEAEIGTWTVRWASGPALGEAAFAVEPFTLPRFKVTASAPKAFYSRGERPRLRGAVTYSSGAPVAQASLQVDWSVTGAWPPPTEWLAHALPRTAVADRAGAFELELPIVPADLRGKATLVARIAATDAANDRVVGVGAVQLAEDAIEVSAVSELEDGLVEGFNNRLYLRAVTSAGVPLPKTTLLVKRAWEPNDKGVRAETDEDGVAALQIDPGPAVNVVIPPMPARPPPRQPEVERTEARELIADELSLADQRALDRWTLAFAPCARFVEESESVPIAVEVGPGGEVRSTSAGAGPAARCLAQVAAGQRLGPGSARILALGYQLRSELPRITHEIDAVGPVPTPFAAAVTRALLDARSCLVDSADPAQFPRLLLFSFLRGAKELSPTWVNERSSEGPFVPASVAACVEGRLARLRLDWQASAEGEEEEVEEQLGRSIGAVRLAFEPAARMQAARPEAQVMLGYELTVEARAGEEKLGSTRLFLRPGTVPPLRLRPSEVVARPGQEISVAVLRGPSWSGELPKKLYLAHDKGALETTLDEQSRVAKWQLPADAAGWYQVNCLSARAVIYVPPANQLELSVRPGAERYAPGELATLALSTRAGGQPTRASVTLVGVDESLAQLVPLPGPDAMAALRPMAQVSSPAFGLLDAQALSMGRIRGANAAVATVLKVTQLPAAEELDASVSASLRPGFEPVEAMTDHFYPVLGELLALVRGWEQSAPRSEVMRPPLVAKLWGQALDRTEAKKLAVVDAYGRRLRLSRLPPDLLALLDPRSVVVDGTRLPEDMDNWAEWVRKERP